MGRQIVFIAFFLLICSITTTLADSADDDYANSTIYYYSYGWDAAMLDINGSKKWEMNKVWYDTTKELSIEKFQILNCQSDEQDNLYIYGKAEKGKKYTVINVNSNGKLIWRALDVGYPAVFDSLGNTFYIDQRYDGNYLTKITSDGAIKWSLKLNLYRNTLFPTNDGGIDIVGISADNNNNELFVRVDPDGRLLSRVIWPSDHPFGAAGKLLHLPNKELIAVVNNKFFTTIICFSYRGNIKWQIDISEDYLINSQAIDNDGNVILTGTLTNETGSYIFVGKYSANGSNIWTQIVEKMHSMKLLIDDLNNIYIVRRSYIGKYSHYDIIKLSSAGKLLWVSESTSFRNPDPQSILLSDSTVILVGMNYDEIHIVSYDHSGKINKNYAYHSTHDNNYSFYSFALASNLNKKFFLAADYDSIRSESTSSESSNDNKDMGCGCDISNSTPTMPLVAVMLLIGIVAMAVSLRRK